MGSTSEPDTPHLGNPISGSSWWLTSLIFLEVKCKSWIDKSMTDDWQESAHAVQMLSHESGNGNRIHYPTTSVTKIS